MHDILVGHISDMTAQRTLHCVMLQIGTAPPRMDQGTSLFHNNTRKNPVSLNAAHFVAIPSLFSLEPQMAVMPK
jgi:hypothetical protein